jgi:hypothetical protein
VPDRAEPPASEETGYNDGARFDGGVSTNFVIPSEARNLSAGLIRAKKTTERFLASLGMTK